jgi:hypothetical protein
VGREKKDKLVLGGYSVYIYISTFRNVIYTHGERETPTKIPPKSKSFFG